MKEISKIQSEIKAIKKYREEANELIKRINNSVSEINSSSEMKIKVIKEKIAADVTELKTYMSEDIYTTKSISLYNYVEKEKSANGDYYYPLANFIIRFNCKCYSIDHEQLSKIATPMLQSMQMVIGLMSFLTLLREEIGANKEM